MGNIGTANINARDLVALATISDQAANADFGTFTAPFSGTATLLLSLPTSSIVNLYGTPVDGASTSLGAINDGTALPASEPQAFTFPISDGASYAFQVATAQSGDLVIHVQGVPR